MVMSNLNSSRGPKASLQQKGDIVAGGFDVTLMTQFQLEISIPMHESTVTSDDLKIILHMTYTFHSN